jgi:hypothetical protein
MLPASTGRASRRPGRDSTTELESVGRDHPSNIRVLNGYGQFY